MSDPIRKSVELMTEKGVCEMRDLSNKQGDKANASRRNIALMNVNAVAKDEETNSFIFIDFVRIRSPADSYVMPGIEPVKRNGFKERAAAHYRSSGTLNVPTTYQIISIHALNDGRMLIRHYVDTVICENKFCNKLTLLESGTITMSQKEGRNGN